MDCDRVGDMMYLFIDNEMEEELLTPFRRHLDDCRPCARRMDRTRQVLVLVRQRCSRHSAPPRLRQRILLSLQQGGLAQELH